MTERRSEPGPLEARKARLDDDLVWEWEFGERADDDRLRDRWPEPSWEPQEPTGL